MKDNMTNIEGVTAEAFSEEAYKARMAAYVKGLNKYRLKEDVQVKSEKKSVGTEVH